MMVLIDISSAPTAGDRMTPLGAKANVMMLYPLAHHRFWTIFCREADTA
jgi:hypothetical protein